MHVRDPQRPPLSPREAWLSNGRQVLHFRPTKYDCRNQALEVTFGEAVMPGVEPPLLKKRPQGWKVCPPQWRPPEPFAQR